MVLIKKKPRQVDGISIEYGYKGLFLLVEPSHSFKEVLNLDITGKVGGSD